MKFFGKKPQKKRKPTSQVKKKPAARKTPPKSQPKTWVPPFPNDGMGSGRTRVLDTQNIIESEPELVKTQPTYQLPPMIPETVLEAADESEPEMPKKTVRQQIKEEKAHDEFMRVFRELTYCRRSWDVWTDFIVMTACALSNMVDKVHYNEREAKYLGIINKYDKEEQLLFPELFAHLVMALEENPEQDFLGTIYTELGLNSKEHKQIFTPYHIARLMAEVTIGDLEEEVKERGFVTIHDTCCGGGVTLIAAVNVARDRLRDTDLNYQNHILVTGQDIDYVAALMCYIQMSLLGVAGYFKVGNSLTDPMTADDSLDNYWFTPMYFFPVWYYRRIFRRLDALFQTERDVQDEIRSN